MRRSPTQGHCDNSTARVTGECTERHTQQSIAGGVDVSECCDAVQDEFVMIETTGEDGTSMQIVYRNGGAVRASAVEMLCDKVGAAL